MGCRKSDIDKYTNDIGRLEEASRLAQSVIDRQKTISADLDNLKAAYGTTVKASDELLNEFHVLDQGASARASVIKQRIDKALEDARSQKSAAEEEERTCEIHHPLIKPGSNNYGRNMQAIM